MDDLEFENAKGVFDRNDVVLPTIDYTPPELITLFFTNEGIMTPIAVSELFLKSTM